MFLAKNCVKLVAPGSPLISIYGQSREIKRWVAPVIREFNKRKKKMGPEPVRPRSSFIEWNYNAELFAFNKRLKEDLDLQILQQAFVDRSYIIAEEVKQKELGVDEPNIGLNDNQKLIESGEVLMLSYVEGFLRFFLPKMPPSLIANIQRHLTSDIALGRLASELGMGDLVLSSQFPPQKEILADTFKAIIGCLAKGSSEKTAFTFIRDFVCTQLNQLDLTELCEIEKPLEQLTEIYKQMNLNTPEPRLIGESARNTVLAAYHIGIYSDKKLIGSGFGENIPSATDIAAYDALRKLWGFPENLKPFNFEVSIENIAKTEQQLKNASRM